MIGAALAIVTVSVVGDAAMIARLRAMPANVRLELTNAVRDETIYEAGYVKDRKLSGQVLNVRTGTLRRSITFGAGTSRIEVGLNRIMGIVGTNVIYGAIHEFGGLVHRVSSLGKAFTAHYPARSFLRTTLQENAERIRRVLTDAVKRAIGAS